MYMIHDIGGNDILFIIILIENYIKMIMEGFFARICTKERLFLKSVEYNLWAGTSLQHDNTTSE